MIPDNPSLPSTSTFAARQLERRGKEVVHDGGREWGHGGGTKERGDFILVFYLNSQNHRKPGILHIFPQVEEQDFCVEGNPTTPL